METTSTDARGAAELRERIRSEALRQGFDLVGFAPVRASDHGAFLRSWLGAGRHGEMAYLAREDAVARRLDPAGGFPGVRTAIVVAHNYYPEQTAAGDFGDDASTDPARGVIARYARGRDYHRVMKKKLLRLLRWLEAEVGRELPLARAYVDTGPVLERELARRAGLGWFGRNCMLIHPRRGSYFFLGVLFVELELEHDEPFTADHCGSCHACVDACPTGALLGRDEAGAPVIDARRCISYLTIELRGPIPRELRPLIGNRIFGCDICQEVCPWNGPKFVQITSEPDYGAWHRGVPAGVETGGNGRERVRGRERERMGGPVLPGTDGPGLLELLRMTYDKWDAWTRGSALRRAGYAGFRRNVVVAVGNWLAGEAVPPGEAVSALLEALVDEEALVRAHAAWALGRVGSAAAMASLERGLAAERDREVIDEIRAALVGAPQQNHHPSHQIGEVVD